MRSGGADRGLGGGAVQFGAQRVRGDAAALVGAQEVGGFAGARVRQRPAEWAVLGDLVRVSSSTIAATAPMCSLYPSESGARHFPSFTVRATWAISEWSAQPTAPIVGRRGRPQGAGSDRRPRQPTGRRRRVSWTAPAGGRSLSQPPCGRAMGIMKPALPESTFDANQEMAAVAALRRVLGSVHDARCPIRAARARACRGIHAGGDVDGGGMVIVCCC
jgi:hypothetical protein